MILLHCLKRTDTPATFLNNSSKSGPVSTTYGINVKIFTYRYLLFCEMFKTENQLRFPVAARKQAGCTVTYM